MPLSFSPDMHSAVQALSNDGSGVTALTERLRSEILSKVTGFGESLALRCLALAYKAMPAGSSQVCSRPSQAIHVYTDAAPAERGPWRSYWLCPLHCTAWRWPTKPCLQAACRCSLPTFAAVEPMPWAGYNHGCTCWTCKITEAMACMREASCPDRARSWGGPIDMKWLACGLSSRSSGSAGPNAC